jgi:hypothetical protein
MRLVVLLVASLLAVAPAPSSGRSSAGRSTSVRSPRGSWRKSTTEFSTSRVSSPHRSRSPELYSGRPASKAFREPSRNKCASCVRNSHGRIQRSATAKRQFEGSNPCPSTGRTSSACSGYVIDHVTAEARWRGRSIRHAVADEGSREGKRQN